MRLIIPEKKTIVVLDTNPARNLAEMEEAPPWLHDFEAMSRDGYSFSLAEIAVAELMAQYDRGSLSQSNHQRMIDRLSLFLNLEMPALAGKKDIYGMLELNVDAWKPEETWQLAQIMWAWLKDPAHDGRPGEELLKELLQEERDDWVEYLRTIKSMVAELAPKEGFSYQDATPEVIAAIDASLSNGSSNPTMAQRVHLHSRYRWRQFVRSQKSKGPYNPLSGNKRNDGIDVDLYIYLMLPAFVVTTDTAFLDGLKDIESFQRGWFVTPETLSAQWSNGTKPRLAWPK
ncbi:UNVERIFIED_ORG: hypothetical protein J2W38_007384 [Variovorax paradoxus]|nr:hypothetical protein [Variovorax paradoxus]